MTTNLSAHTPTDTPIPTGGETTVVPITVTILDAATIFEGPETVYRYDLPGTGIVEGWALGQVMDQISKMAGPSWPEVEACVVADTSGTDIAQEATTIICRQLEVTGVRLVDPKPAISPLAARYTAAPSPHPTAQSTDSAPPTTVMEAPVHEEPIAPTWSDRLRGWLGAIDIFHVAIAVVIIAVAGASWWAIGAQASSNDDAAPESSRPQPRAADPGRDSTPESAPASPESETPSAQKPGSEKLNPGEKHLDVEGMSVVVPSGFHTKVEDGLVTATGEDPNLRILLAADEMFNVPADALFKEIHAQVDEDPDLREATEKAGRLSYTEDPGDGSLVEWTTWEDRGHQMSVGCHTRHNANAVQKAACRMATESLVKK